MAPPKKKSNLVVILSVALFLVLLFSILFTKSGAIKVGIVTLMSTIGAAFVGVFGRDDDET